MEIARVNFFSNLTTAISLALDSIRTHKVRSFLTLLGVIRRAGSLPARRKCAGNASA
jgi:hypothetical protein